MELHTNSVDVPNGAALTAATITVTDSTGAVAAIFDTTGAAKANPFTSDARTGMYSFKAANGTYTVSISKTGIEATSYTVTLFDPADNDGTNGNLSDALQLADYAALRAYAGNRKSVYITGYLASAAPSGIAGMFVRDDADTTSADNGGTVIVASNGIRWKRQYDGPVNLAWFGAVAGSGEDIKPALEAAIATGQPVLVEDGEYFLENPIVPVEGMALMGMAEIPFMKNRGAKIHAPNGFIKHTGARIRAQLYGLHIYGESTLGVNGIDGKMGGSVEGCYIELFENLIVNQQSYLTYYHRNRFASAERGLWLNETNTVHVTDNWFQSSVLVQIDNQTLTPGGALIGGSSLVITGNNFNLDGNTEALALLTQAVKFRDNYVEVYETAMPAGRALIDYRADRFAYAFLEVVGNHMVGQNRVDRALHIWATHSAGTEQHGLVEGNWMRGFRERPILVGNKAGGYDRVSGIQFKSNSSTQPKAVEFVSSAVPHAQAIRATYTEGTLNIAGTGFVKPVLTDALPSMGANLTALGGTVWTVGAPGLYFIEVSASGKSTAEDMLTQEAALQIDGVTVDQRFFPIIRNDAETSGGSTANRYSNVTLSGVYELATGQVVAMAFRNGELLHRASISAFRISDSCYQKV